jgi:hypothetical protein
MGQTAESTTRGSAVGKDGMGAQDHSRSSGQSNQGG